MPQAQRVVGICVGMRPLGESDRVVQLLTGEAGCLDCIARGARASRRRFAGVLDLFVSLRCELLPGRTFWTLRAATPVDARLPLRRSLERIAEAGALCACARQLAPPGLPAEALLDALGWGLDALAGPTPAAAAAALVRMLGVAGILPPLTCGRCQQGGRPLGLEVRGGALLCGGCAPRLQPLSAAAQAALGGAPVTEAAVATEVRGAAQALLAVQRA